MVNKVTFAGFRGRSHQKIGDPPLILPRLAQDLHWI